MLRRELAPPPAEAARPDAPRDPFFSSWAAGSLCWLPEHGMGRLRVHEAPYDAAYLEKYEGYAATLMGRAITAARVDLVARYTKGPLVDVGIGCGAFVRARPFTWGYDVNPAGVEWLRAEGLWRDPYEEPVGAVSLWDVLEHIPDPGALLANVGRYVFTSLPIVPGAGPPALTWKHFRRDEHCWYWTRTGFARWMAAHGFRELECNDTETRLGREDILTFVFQREGGA